MYSVFCYFFFFFFFKQKTAYEMRISDWSSDVCSSDLRAARGRCPALRRALSRAGSTTRYLPSTALATSRPCRPPSVRPGVGAVNHLLPAGGGPCQILLGTEERRVGKECVRTCISRVWPCY